MEQKVSHLFRRAEHKEEQNLEAWSRIQNSIYTQHHGLDELPTRLKHLEVNPSLDRRNDRLDQMEVNFNNRIDEIYPHTNNRMRSQ